MATFGASFHNNVSEVVEDGADIGVEASIRNYLVANLSDASSQAGIHMDPSYIKVASDIG